MTDQKRHLFHPGADGKDFEQEKIPKDVSKTQHDKRGYTANQQIKPLKRRNVRGR